MKITLVSLLAIGAAAAFAADLTADFSISSGNPNGSWTYGIKTSVAGSLTPFATPASGSFGAANVDYWYTASTTPNISKLISGTLNGYNGGVGGITVGDVNLHGGPGGELGVARYTVGSTGLYNLSGFFKSGDALGSQYGNIDGYVYHNSTALYSTINTGVTQTFSLSSVALTAGDTVDIMVGVGQDTYFYDTTPVNLSITPVPEPGTLAVLGMGLLVVLRRRKSS